MAKSRFKPLIALNLKTYEESSGEKGLKLCETAAEVGMLSGVRVIVCPDATLLRAAAAFGADVFAQHVDGHAAGAYTGSLSAHLLLSAGCKGSLVNHSEHRTSHEAVHAAVAALKKVELESMVCARDVRESAQLAAFHPAYVAVEPPELIGSGVSVSTARPDVVSGAAEAIRASARGVGVVCGAGVSTPSDVKKAFGLGVDGVLLASAYVKAKNPRKLLEEMCAQI